MCTVLLPPGVNPTAVNKYIISYHIMSYHISYNIISYHIISYHIISYHIISYHIVSYHIISYRLRHVILSENWTKITQVLKVVPLSDNTKLKPNCTRFFVSVSCDNWSTTSWQISFYFRDQWLKEYCLNSLN